MDATPYTTSSASTALDPPPSSSSGNMARRWARKLERYCCTCVTYFPLAFVYSITSWAVYVDVSLSTTPSGVTWLGRPPPLPRLQHRWCARWPYHSLRDREILCLFRRRSLPPSQLVLYICCLYFPGEHHQRARLQYTPYTGTPYCDLLYSQVQWRI